jgi:hypothetical protein
MKVVFSVSMQANERIFCMIMSLTWKSISNLEADLLENGAVRKSWTLHSDARITTSGASLGVGPCVYTGRPEDPETGAATYDGVVRDALFLFTDLDTSYCVRAILEDRDPTDLQETIEAFMLACGGDVSAMQAKKPTTS